MAFENWHYCTYAIDSVPRNIKCEPIPKCTTSSCFTGIIVACLIGVILMILLVVLMGAILYVQKRTKYSSTYRVTRVQADKESRLVL